MKTIWKLKRLLVLIILGYVGFAQAQTRDDWTGTLEAGTYELTSIGGSFQVKKNGTVLGTYSSIGNLTVNSGNVTIQLKNTNIITFNGQIYVCGGHLTLQKMQQAGGSTLKRYPTYTGRFLFVENTTGTNPDNCRLTLKGYVNGLTESYITINGGDDGFHIVGPDADGNYEAVRENGSEQATNSEHSLLTVAGGHVEVERVEFTRNWLGSTINGSAILVTTNGNSRSQSVVNLNKTLIQNCFVDKSGAAIYTHCELVNNKVSSITINNSIIRNCFANASLRATGGIIRTVGISFCTFLMDNCVFYNNYTKLAGGVTWNAGRVDAIQIKNSEFHHNWTASSGAALNFGSLAEIINCKIHDNYAMNCGGGVAYGTWGSDDYVSDFHPKDGDLVLDANTEIYNNTAGQHGGGLFVDIHPIVVGQSDVIQDTVYTNINGQTYSVKLNVEGASIHNNTAGQDGGGVYMKRDSDIYNTDINLKYGNIYENTAGRNGGALAVTGGAPVNVGSTSGTLNMIDNTAKNGGGIYLQGGNITLANCNVGLLNHPNTASGGNGGGIYVTGGNFTMNSGSFAYNIAERSGNDTGNGGGFCVKGGTVTVKGGSIDHNEAESFGGGFYVDPGTGITTTINDDNSNPIIEYNKAASGGAVYANSGNVSITGADIDHNKSTESHGGAFMVANGDLTVNSSSIDYNRAPNGDGGGAYVGGTGEVRFSSGTSFTYNAAQNGGAISVVGGDLTLDNSTIACDTAYVSGGGIYVAGNVTLQNGAVVKRNEAAASGGGIYVADGGTFDMTGGTVGGTTAEGNKAAGANGAGGGIFMAGGTATITGGAIAGNSATKNGGGIFMDGRETGMAATCTLSNNASIGGTSANYANSAQYGGGIYSAGGTITVKGGKIKFNKATIDGGGIYSAGDKAKVFVQKEGTLLSDIANNTAGSDTQPGNGGGIYALKGIVEFSDGYIQDNKAFNSGGGIYVGETDTLYLKGSATLRGNHVPEGHDGGGVYLLGSLIVGDEPTKALGTITAVENYAGEVYQYDTIHNADGSIHVNANNRNNVYLPFPEVRDNHTGVITVIEDGISTDSHVGFSVPHGNVPVIYCAYSPTSRDYLHQFSTGQQYQYNLFDDTHRYTAVQYSNIPRFDPDHVYLYGFWTNEVTGDDSGLDYCEVDIENDFENADTILISKPCELAFFISWVNGLNNQIVHEAAKAKLVADIDMSEFGWVPIGNQTKGFQGHFDGNGHTVSGIVSMLNTEHTEYGFFGNLNGGTVKDLYVKDASYVIEKKKSHQLFVGGIAGTTSAGSVIENCEASSVIFSDTLNTVMGGLVGRQGGGTVHSSIGIADMTGNLMGGLVGQLEAGDLLNSFANAKFSRMADANAYFGGLVGVNNGHIENCYVRMRGTTPASDKFGWLVGQNNGGGNVQYCYSRQKSGEEKYCANPNGGTFKNYRYYDDNTQTPYLYRRRDNQVTAVETTGENADDKKYIPADYVDGIDNPDLIASGVPSDKQMLHCLNNWVKANSGATTYTKWARPTTKVINDDLPLLLMPHDSINAVAATTGDPYLEYGTVNSRIENFRTSQQAIYMYRTQTDSVVGNGGSDAGLYIDEHVALIQKGELKAHVGITLDNSAGRNGAQPTFGGTAGTPTTDYTDWHMFATPLQEVPLGIKYVKNDGVTEDDTQWGLNGNHYHDAHENGMPYYQFLDNDYDGEQGYFPSHAYGTTYSDDNSGPTTGGSYYQEWDFYCYYEPEYHWINFKRNGNDHWHENAHDVQIEYKPYGYSNVTNEEYLIPGKGYLVATREPNTFLQAEGILNNDTVSIEATRLGYYSPGYNLMGNPYQAYLDFDRFARVNKDLWGDLTDSDIALPSYYIIDEDSTRYITYVQGGSPNPSGAGRFIHPHQGFMILLGEGGGGDFIFAPTMRNIDATGVNFRGESQPAYPLVNLFATEQNGNSSMTTVELGRPDKGGAPVLRDMHLSRGKVYCRYEGEDYAIAFTQPGLTEAAIRFETLEDAEYTMTWNTHNGEFSYLHLIDNLTGADVDCLAETEYRFTAKTTDYKSRFRLVFGYTGIGEPGDDGAPTGTAATSSFAFQMGDQLVVNGEGTLQVFDMAGRQVMATETHGTQTTVGLPRMAAGVYTMRLTNTRSTQVQKIVIR